jgi:hypothetical protein
MSYSIPPFPPLINTPRNHCITQLGTTMKRPLQEHGDKSWSVREWAAALHPAEDQPLHSRARSLERILRRFVRIIRRERREALYYHNQRRIIGDEEDGDVEELKDPEDTPEDEDEDELIPMKGAKMKRLKKDELWKEDSASYNVPFVGTSTASRILPDYSVERDQWPTGLLHAYLVKSPLAAEFFHETLLPRALCKDHSNNIHQALLDKLKQKSQTNTKEEEERYQSLSKSLSQAYWLALSELLTAALSIPQLMDLETYATPTPSSANNKERQPRPELPRFISEFLLPRLSGVLSVLSDKKNAPITPVLLNILTQLAATSASVARTMARAFEPTSTNRSFLRSLYIYPSQKSTATETQLQKEAMKRPAFVAALRLLVTLLRVDDPVVMSCIAMSNTGPDKATGILFGAVHRAFPSGADLVLRGEFEEIAKHHYWILRFLQVLRQTLLRSTLMNAANQRYLRDLFTRESLQLLCDIASSWAPSLTNDELVEILSSRRLLEDDEINLMHLQTSVGTEARRLFLLLLLDAGNSPLLRAIADGRIPAARLIPTLQHWFRRDTTLAVTRCIGQVVTLTPALFPALMQAFSLTDDPSVSVLPRLHALTTWLRVRPPGQGTLPADVLDSIVPMACRKANFIKLLHHSNPLTACASFQLLVTVLQRGRDAAAQMDPAAAQPLLSRMAELLPELTVFTSVLSKPWEAEPAVAVVKTWACTTLRSYRLTFTGLSSSVDVSKWLPSSVIKVTVAPKIVQRIHLATIQDYLPLHKVSGRRRV